MKKKYEIINKSVTRDAIQWIHPAQPLHSDKLSIHNGIASLPSPSPSSSSSSPASLHSTVLSHLLIIDAYTHILWNLFNFNRFAVYTTQKPQVIRIFIFTTRVATATTNGNNVQWIEFLGICSRVQTIWYCVYCTLYKLHRNVSLQRKGSFMFDIAWIVLKIFPKLIRFFFSNCFMLCVAVIIIFELHEFAMSLCSLQIENPSTYYVNICKAWICKHFRYFPISLL